MFFTTVLRPCRSVRETRLSSAPDGRSLGPVASQPLDRPSFKTMRLAYAEMHISENRSFRLHETITFGTPSSHRFSLDTANINSGPTQFGSAKKTSHLCGKMRCKFCSGKIHALLNVKGRPANVLEANSDTSQRPVASKPQLPSRICRCGDFSKLEISVPGKHFGGPAVCQRG